MSHNQQPVDEYTLAAFLAGTLEAERRREVIAFLAENPDARDLLCMSQEAMEAAAHQPVSEPFAVAETIPDSIVSPADAEPRHMPRLAEPRSPLIPKRLSRIASTVLMILVLSVALHLGWNWKASDTLRGSAQAEPLTLHVSTPVLQFEWPAVKEAYYYNLVIYDVEKAERITKLPTKSTYLGRDDAFVLSLYKDLQPDHLYSARIDAFDVQNRIIESSNSVEFSFQE